MTVPSELVEGPIYLDHNATTPVDPAVIDAMLPYLTGGFGNPSSEHHYGRAPRTALEHARTQVAALLGAQDGQIVFTGSGSEADNLAIRGRDRPRRRPHRHSRPAAAARMIKRSGCDGMRR